MKTCPVCGALAFDDAATCFGCMHRFGDGPEEAPTPAPVPTSEDAPPAPAAGEALPAAEDAPPEFRIRFIPTRDPTGSITWNCTVEV